MAMLDDRQQFKVAFLARCARQGLTAEETLQAVKHACDAVESGRLTKQSVEKAAGGPWAWAKDTLPGVKVVEDFASGVGKSLGGGLGSAAVNTALLAAIGLPIAAGGAAGYGLAKLQGLNDTTPEEIKLREKIDAYRRVAARAKLHRPQPSHRGSRLLA